MKKLTKEQAITVMAYTGFATCDFSLFHKAVENKLGRPIFTHQFANDDICAEIKAKFKDDFVKLCPQK